MSNLIKQTNRREFLKTAAIAGGAAVVAGVARPGYTAENNTIQVALIGCGGRGSGAAQNALNAKHGPIKLVAMADAFENRLQSSYDGLKGRYANQVDVPEDHRFVGFDAYRRVIEHCDVVLLTTPPGRDSLEQLYESLDRLHRLQGSELARALNIPLGFNAHDGD